jgi:hypothetical protein
MTSDLESTLPLAEDAKLAHSQDKFQTPKEPLVSTDHSLNAQIASLEDLMTTTLVNNAQLDKLKIQET